MFVAATVALHAHEPVFEPAAAQIVLEFGEYEPRQRGFLLVYCIEQDRQVLLDDWVERGVLRLVPLIVDSGRAGLLSG